MSNRRLKRKVIDLPARRNEVRQAFQYLRARIEVLEESNQRYAMLFKYLIEKKIIKKGKYDKFAAEAAEEAAAAAQEKRNANPQEGGSGG
jgi:hypothetical protein